MSMPQRAENHKRKDVLLRRRAGAPLFKKINLLFALVLFTLGLSHSALAQDVSLLADDTIDDIKVKAGDIDTTVTVMRDAYNPNQWYYVPTRPRLVQVTNNGRKEPVFHLYRYQFENPVKPGELLEGGLLMFSATLALDDSVLVELRKQILAQKKDVDPNKLALSALRMKSAKAQLYSPGASGVFVATPPDGNGDAPIFTTQEMAFAVDLTKIGVSLYKDLLEGKAGLKLQVDFTYGGLTPPAGFTVTADYKQALDYYGSNSVFQAQASYFGLWGASYKNESTEIRQKLEESGALKIDVIEGSGFKKEDIDKYLQPIIKRINDQVLEMMTPPERIEAPKADPSGKGGFFGSASYSVATKKVNQLKQLKDVINMRYRMYEERKTSAAATISLTGYPKEVRETLFSTVQNLNWDSAFFRLPEVDVAADAGVKQVDLSVLLASGDKKLPEKSFTWTPSAGWMDVKDSKPTSGTVFALLGEGFTGDTLKNANYTVTYGFTAHGKNQSYKVTEPAFTGSRPLTTPTQGMDALVIDGSNLTFKEMEDAGKKPEEIDKNKKKLLKVTVVVDSTQDRPVAPVEIKAGRAGGDVIAAKPVSLILVNPAFAQNPSPVSLTVTFYLSDGTKVLWTGNTNDLRRDYPDMNITLVDVFWDKGQQ
jgi:hypothetical protein